VRRLGLLLLLAVFAVLSSSPLLAAKSSHPSQLTIAAAANLANAFTAIANQFQTETDIKVTLSFGATRNFAAQIRDGTPFDLFAAADVVTVNALIQDGFMLVKSQTLYAQGDERLVEVVLPTCKEGNEPC
jgi:molybdate transport system substrate-binding protein